MTNRSCAVACALLIWIVTQSAVMKAHSATPRNAVYDAHCAVCHQAGAVGVPGAFPRLVPRAAALAAQPKGRKLMVSAVLYGMSGKLQVDREPIIGVMPPLPQLDDKSIASVLTYIVRLSGKLSKPFDAAEVAAIRAQPKLSSAQVNALAQDPELFGASP